MEDVTRVTVYSNQPIVELFANGESIGRKQAEDHFFCFDVPNRGRTKLVAVAGKCRDESEIHKVETFNENYRLREKGAVLNWFDITQAEGYFSLNDKVGDILQTQEGKKLLEGIMKPMQGEKAMGFEMTEGMMQMMNGFTLLRLMGLMGAMNVRFTKEDLLELNAMLNQIKKPQ